MTNPQRNHQQSIEQLDKAAIEVSSAVMSLADSFAKNMLHFKAFLLQQSQDNQRFLEQQNTKFYNTAKFAMWAAIASALAAIGQLIVMWVK